MTDAELLTKVKIGLFGTAQGEWRDEMLTVFIDEVKAFMSDAGVASEVLTSEKAVGCIMIGVNDLMNYQPGGVRFSDYFNKRVIQLCGKGGASNATT